MARGFDYEFLPELFLRAPFYSFARYDPDRLGEVLGDKAFREAIRLASEPFFSILEKKDFCEEALTEKERHTLLKYYNRMSFRPTPFGSFASFTLLKWAAGDRVRLCPAETSNLHLIDVRDVLKRTDVSGSTEEQLSLNPTLYTSGREFRYLRSFPEPDGRYTYLIEAWPRDRFSNWLVSRLKKRPFSVEGLCQAVSNYAGTACEEAASYVDFLQESQIVLPASRASLIGPSPVITRRSGEGGGGASFYAALERDWTGGGPGTDKEEQLRKSLAILMRLAGVVRPRELDRFIGDFKAKYDRAKIPLLTALDPDGGIAYGSSAFSPPDDGDLRDVRFPAGPVMAAAEEWTPLHQMLFSLWRSGQGADPFGQIDINEKDLDAFRLPRVTNPLPTTLAVMFRICGDQLLIEHTGPAAAALIARFSVFNDEVSALAGKLASVEAAENPGVVFADIGVLSHTHVDNINRRRAIFPYEIPVNVVSALGAEWQLPPADLILSIRNDELILESLKLGKRVIPRLASAYNYRNNNLSIIRLLGDLQFAGTTGGIGIDPEALFPGLDFYPRICVAGNVVSPARWIFGEHDIQMLTQQGAAGLTQLRSERGIARLVELGAADQQLVFDLSDPAEIRFFLNCIKGLKSARIKEHFRPGRAVVSEGGPLAGQFIAFLHRQGVVYPPLALAPSIKRGIPREFKPGGPWLYLKYYCTPAAADRLMTEVIFPVLQKHSKRIKCWFFIRYGDPGHHLRLRIKADAQYQGILMGKLYKRLHTSANEALVRDVSADTYKQELERYGEATIGSAEDVFCAGSLLVARFLSGSDQNLAGWQLLQFALITAAGMIGWVYPEPGGAAAFAARAAGGFLAEYGADKLLKIDLDTVYRKKQAEISKWMDEASGSGPSFIALEMSVRELFRGGINDALLSDIVHMQMNRTFSEEPRKHELLVYHCLSRYWASLHARNRAGKTWSAST